MKKLILGAGAFLLSSSAFAGIVHAGSVNDPLTVTSAAYSSSTPWAMSPDLQSTVVQAGLNHLHPATNADWMAGNMAGKSGSAEKAVSALYGEFDGAMSYQEAAAFAGDKNTELTAAQLGEKQAWLAQSGSAMGGKNTALSAEQIAEKQTWLAENGAGASDVAMAAGKGGEMNGQGGPFEAAAAGTDAVWPACRPGPGDDRCIQRYERGVNRAFAQWSAGRSRMGMGGPEEPVGKSETASITSDMSVAVDKADNAMGPTTEPTGVRAQGKSALSAKTGMGKAPGDMAAADGAMVSGGMTAEQMQANSAWSGKANGS